jgi:tripartite ATP-independent transporter DctP family solute receptor
MWLVAMVALIAVCAPACRSEPVTLTFSHPHQTTHPAHLAAMQFAKRVEARSKGDIKVEIFPAAQLGSDTEVVQRIRLGAIDLDLPSIIYLTKYEKAFAAVAMPYLFDSYAHAHRVLDGPAKDWFSRIAERQGIVILSNWERGFRHITNNKRPINTPEDMRGLKIRVPPGAELEATMEALGATVSKINFSELYMALSQGAVDGQENPINIIYNNKFYEVQKYLALTQHVYWCPVHIISKKTWERLTPAQQELLIEESKLAGDSMRKMIVGEEEDLIAKMGTAGVKVTQPDPKLFRAQAQPARDKISRFIGEENVRRFLSMVEEARRP